MLSDLLASLKIEAASISMLNYAGQWEHDVDTKGASVTMVAEGNCQLQGRKDHPIRLSRGDCVIAPRGSAYRLAADIEARPSTSNATHVITLGYLLREGSPVLAALPDLMFIRSAELRHGDWPALVEDFLGDKENAGQPGGPGDDLRSLIGRSGGVVRARQRVLGAAGDVPQPCQGHRIRMP